MSKVTDDDKFNRVMNLLDGLKCPSPSCSSLDVYWESKLPGESDYYILAGLDCGWLVCNTCGHKYLREKPHG